MTTKTVETLVDDMNEVIEGRGGWTGNLGSIMGNGIATVANQRFNKPQEPRAYLSLSGIGTPCKRKLWYKINKSEEAEKLKPNTLLKFFFGDMIEELALTIAKAAGHTVEGMQDRLNVHGIKGHRDAVIDGMTVDVKSASPFAFKKFRDGNLREDDPFGYISQLSSYVYAGQDDPLVTNKTQGAFLVIDKVNGHVCLDMYDFTEELKTKEQEMLAAKELVAGDIPEDRIPPVPQSKTSPNTKLDMTCNYCEFNRICWPEARTFLYSTGPVHLVDVVNEPRAFEVERNADF
jgi:CRISPR/Cas system-associated exonuclease Cas4 (RecB family)